ncbi:hypothetical protein BJX65DRAFT_80368 [Aspergillus insuetus]
MSVLMTEDAAFGFDSFHLSCICDCLSFYHSPFTHFLMISHCSLGFVQYPVLILYVVSLSCRWLVFVSCRRKASNRWKLTSIYIQQILLTPGTLYSYLIIMISSRIMAMHHFYIIIVSSC